MQKALIIHTKEKYLDSEVIEWMGKHAGMHWFHYTVAEALMKGWTLLAKPEYMVAGGRDPDYWEWWLVRDKPSTLNKQKVLIIQTKDKDLSSDAFEWMGEHAGNYWSKFTTIENALEKDWELLAKPEYMIASGRDPGYWEWWLVRTQCDFE